MTEVTRLNPSPSQAATTVGTAVEAGAELTERGAQTRQLILNVAIDRFGRDGFRATSVTDIARAAGVSGSLAYAYFPNKEALFLAAVDEDAAGVIREGLSSMLGDPVDPDWRQLLIFTLLGAVDHHPLAKRLLAGLEPEVTGRVLDIPALAELRKVVTDRLTSDQLSGHIRTDIDPASIADGVVSVMLSLLMSVVQLGADTIGTHAAGITAIFEAAIGRRGDG